MGKLSAEERSDISQIVSSKGWPLLKSYIEEYAAMTFNIIVSTEDDAEALTIAAAKLKYGTISLHMFFDKMEKIRDGLDKKEDL